MKLWRNWWAFQMTSLTKFCKIYFIPPLGFLGVIFLKMRISKPYRWMKHYQNCLMRLKYCPNPSSKNCRKNITKNFSIFRVLSFSWTDWWCNFTFLPRKSYVIQQHEVRTFYGYFVGLIWYLSKHDGKPQKLKIMFLLDFSF